MGTILEARRVSRFFGGIQAVKDVSFALNHGEILGLIGPNGAGKTTLFNVIAGVFKPTSGQVLLQGRDISGLKPHQVCHLGIGRTFQIVKPFLSLSVLQNVVIGSRFGEKEALVDGRDHQVPAAQILQFVGFAERMHDPCSSLNLGEMKRVDLARALATKPEVLLLDEVMAGLNLVETEQMMKLICRIRDEMKITILMIEHVMRAVMGISNRVMVLHHGEKIAEGFPEEVARNEEVVQAYLGERIL